MNKPRAYAHCPDCRREREMTDYRRTGRTDEEGNPLYVMTYECGHSTQIS